MCPHVPAFPPQWKDFAPGRPPIEPPLPRFMWNPLTPEQKAALREEFGPWAGGRTIGMVSPRETFEFHRRVALDMYERFAGKAPPRTKEPRARKEPTPRKPTFAEELAPIVGTLTPIAEEKLTDAALEDIINIRERKRRELTTAEKTELARAVVAWAEDIEGVSITEEQGKSIVDKAIVRFAPERA